MGRARAGAGMHRQFWVGITCPRCGLSCRARRALPGRPWYIRTHFDGEGELCPPAQLGEARPMFASAPDPDQLVLDLG